MKFLFAVSTFLAVAIAQDLGSLPACGQMCVNNMLGLAPSLGCSPTDAKCLCSNANFAHGLNDCSLQACGAAVQAQVVAFGTSYCSAAGVPLGGAGGNTAGGAGTATGTATATGTGGSGGTTTGTNTGTAATGSAASSASSVLSGASASASSSLASVSSSVNSALSTATKSASGSSSGAGSSSSASGFAMPTAAPLAGAGVLGLAAILLV